MSGQPPSPVASFLSPSENDLILSAVRRLSGVTEGPDDAHVLAAVRGFVRQFDRWYVKVMREAVAKYRTVVLKSGLVTRNSDIMSGLKRNARKAEQLLRQDGKNRRVVAHYAIAAGKTESSFEDGINRPSSAEVWAHMTGLPEQAAVDLCLAIAAATFFAWDAGMFLRKRAGWFDETSPSTSPR